jgi:hypothetical protein
MGRDKLLRLLAWMTLAGLIAAGVPMLLTWRTPAEPAVAPPPGSPAAVLVDLKENITSEDVARLERESGLDLQENSIEFPVDHLMRADVPADREAAALAALRADPAVDIAEPEVLYRIPAGEEPSPAAVTVAKALRQVAGRRMTRATRSNGIFARSARRRRGR